MENKKPHSYESELRQDLVTGDWVVIATARAKRPNDFSQERERPKPEHDIFDVTDPEKSDQEKATLIYRRENGDWSLWVFPNKYPAVSRGKAVREISVGPYFAMTGVGYHEVMVTRDPERSLALLDQWQVAEVIDAYQERYLDLMNKKSVNYIQIFHNHGPEAGGHIAHPHSQLIAVPVVSPYVENILSGAERYYRSNRHKVYSVMVEHELETKERLVYENDDFVVLAPYASRAAFELWVVSKRPNPYFERITNEEKFSCADALQKALFGLYAGLKDPDYNFYIYTAPCNGQDYAHFQWHIQILPHTGVWGGFEYSTGIEISTIEPEKAALYLKAEIEKYHP